MPNQSSRIFAGAMSGTSADGVDAAIVEISGSGHSMIARLLGFHHLSYSTELRQRIFRIRDGAAPDLGDLAGLGRDISLRYAEALLEVMEKSIISPDQITAIGAHGQTIFHHPPLTIQWFDPSLLASRAGAVVVSDFRRADCALGGQGAPLVPFADYLLFRDPTKNRVLLNLGGIANLTWLKAGGAIEDLIAFDTGPGNCLSDWLIRTRTTGGSGCDFDGAGASRGKPIEAVVARCLDDAYFRSNWPKSTDGPGMIATFQRAIDSAGRTDASTDDLLATTADLTARSIVDAIRRLPGAVDEVIASGGGVRNRAIMRALQKSLGESVELRELTEFPADAKEAIAFAIMAAATIDGVPSNVPSVTGATRPAILGSISPIP